MLPMIKKPKEVTEARYMKGAPREYRFSADVGKFYTQRKSKELGSEITVVPIMVNAFNAPADFMGNESYSGRPFVQLFFLNQKGSVCSLMFHSASARSFTTVAQDAFYDNLEITFNQLHMKAVKVSSKGGREYYKLEFELKALDAKDSSEIQDLCADILDGELFSLRTAHLTMVDLSGLNMSVPQLEAPDDSE